MYKYFITLELTAVNHIAQEVMNPWTFIFFAFLFVFSYTIVL